jgi:hypothetical protein
MGPISTSQISMGSSKPNQLLGKTSLWVDDSDDQLQQGIFQYGAYYWKWVLTITGKTWQKPTKKGKQWVYHCWYAKIGCSLSKTNAELHTQKSLIMSGQSNTTIRLSKDDTSDDDQNQPTTIRV